MIPTPTPDGRLTGDAATDAAPLTAEEIAALLDKIDMQLDAGYPLGVEEVQPLYSAMEQLLGRNAALRDRLARAEERCEALEGTLQARTDQIVDAIENPPFYRRRNRPCCAWCGEPNGDHQSWCWISESINLIGYPDHFATPTDGAARAGDAAGDGGGAT